MSLLAKCTTLHIRVQMHAYGLTHLSRYKTTAPSLLRKVTVFFKYISISSLSSSDLKPTRTEYVTFHIRPLKLTCKPINSDGFCCLLSCPVFLNPLPVHFMFPLHTSLSAVFFLFASSHSSFFSELVIFLLCLCYQHQLTILNFQID